VEGLPKVIQPRPLPHFAFTLVSPVTIASGFTDCTTTKKPTPNKIETKAAEASCLSEEGAIGPLTLPQMLSKVSHPG
jgi:hypothetical protein